MLPSRRSSNWSAPSEFRRTRHLFKAPAKAGAWKWLLEVTVRCRRRSSSRLGKSATMKNHERALRRWLPADGCNASEYQAEHDCVGFVCRQPAGQLGGCERKLTVDWQSCQLNLCRRRRRR